MAVTFYHYPNCNSCRKAKKWLEENNIEYIDKHIVKETPTKEDILPFFRLSKEKPRRFFNTSGKAYREQNTKAKIKDATEGEIATYLASTGMLMGRPMITDGNNVTIDCNADVLREVGLA